MIDFSVVLLVLNGLVLLVILVMMIMLMRSAAIYSWEIAVTPRKEFHSRRILKLILISIGVSFLAGVINLIFG